jgi:glyoxylase-like metal-dependent hydrolase (beta-lactamase superfamily II)
MSESHGWQSILADVEVFHDSCNVYAVKTPAGTIFINAGTGGWLDSLPERFGRPHTLLCTHYFRDHSAGAASASRAGMTVFAPEAEVEIFADPIQHFRERPSYIVYDNIWETFAPIEPANVLSARDYDTLCISGLKISVVPLPGVTPNHCGYSLITPISQRAAVFCGEAIHSAGRMARIAPLQYDYNDLGGAVNASFSANELRRLKPEILFPSLGDPITQSVDGALAALQQSLRMLCAGRPSESALIDIVEEDQLERVTDHVLISTRTEALSTYLISQSGKALVIDYGYRGSFGVYPPSGGGKMWHWPASASRSRRRPLLHGIEPLKRQFNIDRIDVALISHFHDDHVAGVPILQRFFGTQCWIPEKFVHLLEHPEAHRFPCDWPQPIRADRCLPLDQPFEWQEFRFLLAPMSGHTRFSAAICFEADGKRFAHTGDQLLLNNTNCAQGEGIPANATIYQNHVYRNGAFIGCYRETAELLKRWRPDIVLSGHRLPVYTNKTFFALLDDWGSQFDEMHCSAMVLGEDEAHFGLDSWGGWIWPYRLCVREGEAVCVHVNVRNPLPTPADLTVRLVGPQGWRGSSATMKALPRGEEGCDLTIMPNGRCRRQPIAAELLIGERSFGQVAEALVTVGGPTF